MTQTDWQAAILALTIWREASGTPVQAQKAVACSIRNRVQRPGWWGIDWESVCCKPLQYSSMTVKGDPNTVRWPIETDTSWQSCMQIATDCISGALPDSVEGATNYYDASMDANPPSWAAQMTHVTDCWNFRFYR